MRTTFLFILTLLFLHSKAQYSTPNNGETISLDVLVSLSGNTVTFENGSYLINENLTISENDTLWVSGEMIHIAENVLVTIEGGFLSSDGATFTTAQCCDSFYEGFRFEENAFAEINETIFSYGGGLKVLGGNFSISNSEISHMTGGVSEFSALGFSAGKPVVTGCTFSENEFSAISSAANADPAPLIENCTFSGNVTSNTNRPQINLGPSGADTTIIRGNVVQGDPSLFQVGGIAFALLAGGEGHVILEQNLVFDNRYGVTVYGGNVTSLIRDNAFTDNNTQDEPLLGGSGISITGFGENNYHVITGNTFSGNLWGVTLIQNAYANLGDIQNEEVGPGLNQFENNGNEGQIYALYNNTANEIPAEGNCWIASNPDFTEDDAENVISHIVDDLALGEVDFLPLGSCGLVYTDDQKFEDWANLYPNPSRGQVMLELKMPVNAISVFDMHGRQVLRMTDSLESNKTFDLSDLEPGVYLVQLIAKNGISTTKLVLQ